MHGKIFISYRREDNALAWALLRDRLIAEFGRDHVFFDQYTIPNGDDWRAVIDRELAQASLVVMVCGRHWAGPYMQDGRSRGKVRRIDRPTDMVRYELARAHALGRRIEPFLIDPNAMPARDRLPADLQFLSDINYRPFSPLQSPLEQLDRWIDHLKNLLYGRQRKGHFLQQGLWTAWIATSLVWLAMSGQWLDGLRDGYDRFVQRIAALEPSPIDMEGAPTRVVTVEFDEFRELLGGRTPLDPEIMTILVDTLHRASRQVDACKPGQPIGLALELAPGEAGSGNENYQHLAVALRRLAACRPVVLTCPQSIRSAAPPEADRLWLDRLTEDRHALTPAEFPERPVLVASADLDATVLRTSANHAELGAVVGNLRRQPSELLPALPPCGCAWRRHDRDHCQTSGAGRWNPDPSTLLVPRTYGQHSLTEVLQHAPALASSPALFIGGNFAHQDRISAAALPEPAPLVTLHASTADAIGEDRLTLPPFARYLGACLTAAVVASTMMLLWRDVALHPHLYARRLRAYGLFAALVLGLPIVFAASAAASPTLVPLASLASFAVWAVAMRAGLSGYEVLIDRGEGWRPFQLNALWRGAAVEGRERWTARWRLALFLVETVIGLSALSMALLATAA